MQGMSFQSWQVSEGLLHGLEGALGFAGGSWRVEGRSTLEGDGQREAERKGSQCAGHGLRLLWVCCIPGLSRGEERHVSSPGPVEFVTWKCTLWISVPLFCLGMGRPRALEERMYPQ